MQQIPTDNATHFASRTSSQEQVSSIWIFIVLMVVSAAMACVATAEPKYIYDDAHGLVRFTVKLAGVSDVEGRFGETNAAITYNEADPAQSSVTAFIYVNSIDTAEKERDHHLCTADFFDAAKFPVIRFQSKRIEKSGEDWVAVGDLTMHGQTHEIELPFQWVQKKEKDPFGNDRIGFEAHTKLKRSDYGITGPDFWGGVISDDVDIVLRITARIYNWDDINGSDKSFIPQVLPLFEKDEATAMQHLIEIQSAGTSQYDRGQSDYHILGRKLYQHGKFKAACDVFTLAAKLFPQSSQAVDDLADAYQALGDKKQALALFEKSEKIDPYDANALENLRSMGK